MTPSPRYRLQGRVRAAGIVVVLTVTLLSAGAAALGQHAQALAYRSSNDAKEVIGATPGQPLAWSWDAPTDLALPPFVSKEPLFARWQSPTVPGGAVQMALDPSVADGPYERLFIDTNANGRLDDELPVQAFSATKTPLGQSVDFRQVPVQLTGPGGGMTYHLNIVLEIKGREPSEFVATAAGWREGSVRIGRATLECVLIDTHANGTFNDSDEDPTLSDAIWLGGPSAALMAPVAPYIEVDGRLFGLEVPQDGSSVTLAPMGTNIGFFRVPIDIVRVGLTTARGQGRQLAFNVRGGRFPVPADWYRVDSWVQRRKDSSGKVWALEAVAGRALRHMQILASRGTDLDLGEPVIPWMTTTWHFPSGYTFSNPRLSGRGGEHVTLTYEGRPAPPPTLEIVSAGGAYRWTLRFGRGYLYGVLGNQVSWKAPRDAPRPFGVLFHYDGPFRIERRIVVR